jgi:hypothetical protein
LGKPQCIEFTQLLQEVCAFYTATCPWAHPALRAGPGYSLQFRGLSAAIPCAGTAHGSNPAPGATLDLFNNPGWVIEQVLQNAPHFAFSSGICSETEVSEQLYYLY